VRQRQRMHSLWRISAALRPKEFILSPCRPHLSTFDISRLKEWTLDRVLYICNIYYRFQLKDGYRPRVPRSLIRYESAHSWVHLAPHSLPLSFTHSYSYSFISLLSTTLSNSHSHTSIYLLFVLEVREGEGELKSK
jgi:hypothetical protein